MTNETLAAAIRDGNHALIGELWGQVRAFVAMMAKKRLMSNESTVTEVDDLTQCGYFALLDAIQTYDETESSFLTWLSVHLQNHFNKAMNRYTTRQKQDPLHTADSLQRPISDDDDSAALWDFLPDESAQAAFDAVEHRIWNGQLHAALTDALDAIPDKQREIIEGRYYAGKTVDELAAIQAISPAEVRSHERKGMSALRKGAAYLRPFLNDETNYFRRVSVSEFNRTHTSAVESIAIWHESQRGNPARVCPAPFFTTAKTMNRCIITENKRKD